jgi:hypothetical protein
MQPFPNGSLPQFCGDVLSAIKNCPVDGEESPPLTVTISGHPTSFYTIPAYAEIGSRQVRGYVTRDENGWMFHIEESP